MATKLRRTLLVGLGGTGMNSLLHTKKMLYDTYGEVPPMIGFLGIDTDGGVYNRFLTAKDGNTITLSQSEQLPISVNTPIDIYERKPDNFDWMPRANASSLTALNIGAGQVRSNGRFALTIHETDVRNRIQNKIQQIKSAHIIDNDCYKLLGTDLEIHMVFSLSGGTGAGTFINMAYLLRNVAPDAKLSGYAVMADVFRAMMQGAGVARVRPNALGAIRDLDFLMHLDSHSTPVEIKWLKETETVKHGPFTAFYFIDNRNENGDVFSNVDQLCEMISLALVITTGELSVAAASVSDNVAKVIGDGSMDIVNKKAWAAGFGVSEIIFNGAPLAKIYESKAKIQLIAKMLNGGCDDASEIANSWIDTVRIRENQGKDDVIDYFMPSVAPRILDGLDTPDQPKTETQLFLNNSAMPSEKDLNTLLTELEGRIDKELSNLLASQANRECGIYLCEGILNTLLSQVNLCDDEMKEEIKEFEENEPMRQSAYDAACKELEDCMNTLFKIGKKDKINEVCETTMALARIRREIKRRKMARQFYSWLKTEINKRFDIVNTIMSNLNASKEESVKTIETIRQNIGHGSFFEFDLAVKEANSIACHPSDIVFNDFIHDMRKEGGVISLAQVTASRTSELLDAFVAKLPKAQSWTGKTVDDIINDMDDAELNDLCSKAIQKSLPLFPYGFRGYDPHVKVYPSDNYYVGVADKDKSRLFTSGIMKNMLGTNIDFASTGIKDRVIIYRQIGVIPPFALSSVESYLSEYERFENEKPYTSHWDAKLCERMKKERFSLMPQDEVKEGDVLGVWINCLIAGLLTYDATKGQYMLKSRALGGKGIYGYKVPLGERRSDAFRHFTDNYDAVVDEINAELVQLDVPGPYNILKKRSAEARESVANGSYVNGFSLNPIALEQLELYPEELELINKEIEFLEKI